VGRNHSGEVVGGDLVPAVTGAVDIRALNWKSFADAIGNLFHVFSC